MCQRGLPKSGNPPSKRLAAYSSQTVFICPILPFPPYIKEPGIRCSEFDSTLCNSSFHQQLILKEEILIPFHSTAIHSPERVKSSVPELGHLSRFCNSSTFFYCRFFFRPTRALSGLTSLAFIHSPAFSEVPCLLLASSFYSENNSLTLPP